MEFNAYIRDTVTVFELDGKLDAVTSPEIQDKVMTYISTDCRLIINVERCSYISSAGLRVLLVIAKQTEKSGGIAVLAGPSQEVEDVIDMTGFSSIFKIYSDVDTAVADIKEGNQ